MRLDNCHQAISILQKRFEPLEQDDYKLMERAQNDYEAMQTAVNKLDIDSS